MATYEEIYGKRVKDFDSDPTLESSYEGQVWYDKSSGVLKSVVSFDSFTWSHLIQQAINISYNTTGFGTQTASVLLEEAALALMITHKNIMVQVLVLVDLIQQVEVRGTAGVLTAGLAWGGNSSPEVESQLTNEYNGTSWTNVNNYPITVSSSCKEQWNSNSTSFRSWRLGLQWTFFKLTTNEYDGTNWTGGGNLNTAKNFFLGWWNSNCSNHGRWI